MSARQTAEFFQVKWSLLRKSEEDYKIALDELPLYDTREEARKRKRSNDSVIKIEHRVTLTVV
jgi:hypothetical protein